MNRSLRKNQSLSFLLSFIKFRIENSTACQNLHLTFTSCQFLSRISHQSLDFEVKLFSGGGKLLQNLLSKKQSFGSIYTVKASRLAFSCWLEKHDSEEVIFWKETFLETVFLRRFRFWITFFTTGLILNQEFWTCQIWANILQLVIFCSETLRTC